LYAIAVNSAPIANTNRIAIDGNSGVIGVGFTIELVVQLTTIIAFG